MGYTFTKYSVGNGSSGDYVLELTGVQGTLTDEQYNALVENAPNVVLKIEVEGTWYVPLLMATDGVFVFKIYTDMGGNETIRSMAHVDALVTPDKRYDVLLEAVEAPSKTYVDNLFGTYIADIDTLVGGDA